MLEDALVEVGGEELAHVITAYAKGHLGGSIGGGGGDSKGSGIDRREGPGQSDRGSGNKVTRQGKDRLTGSSQKQALHSPPADARPALSLQWHPGSRSSPMITWVRSLVPKEKNSALSAMVPATRAALTVSIMVPT